MMLVAAGRGMLVPHLMRDLSYHRLYIIRIVQLQDISLHLMVITKRDLVINNILCGLFNCISDVI